jgi:hypothetical protein
MAGTTTNNGWDYPTSTDLLKDGALAIQTLATDIDTSVGTGLLAWTSYTPTFSGFTLGNGTISFAYAQIGKTVHLRGAITFGSTSTYSGTFSFTAPVNNFSTGGSPIVGNAYFADTGTQTYLGYVRASGASAFVWNVINASGTYAFPASVTNTVPHTWANTDAIVLQATYQAV